MADGFFGNHGCFAPTPNLFDIILNRRRAPDRDLIDIILNRPREPERKPEPEYERERYRKYINYQT